MLIPLSKLLPNHAGTITEVPPNHPRLAGIGFTPGTAIVRLYSAPSGSPTAYLVRGAVVALRTSDADRILVSTEDCP